MGGRIWINWTNLAPDLKSIFVLFYIRTFVFWGKICPIDPDYLVPFLDHLDKSCP